MAKRIYWERVKKWAVKAGIPAGIAGFVLLFIYLSSLGVIEVTEHSGDMICAGTLEDPCFALINFTVKEDVFIYPTNYDPYGRDTPFETDKGLESWKMYRSWGNTWRAINLSKTWSSKVKYAIKFSEGQDYQIKIVAYKKDPTQDVKWGFGPADPAWFGVPRDIGYEFLDDNKVVHIWNTQDDYFFNKSSGIQFTNHYEDYWTRNIFCIGFYNASGDFVPIKCADELNNFNREIHSDNETYVNATLWKDISYGAYDLRLAVNYYLGLDDKNLSITIYGKNIGIDIPFDLGFAWKIADWDIPYRNTTGGDSIKINNTEYKLDGIYNLLFRNMTESHTEKVCYNNDTNNCSNETVHQSIPTLKGFDKVYGKYLRLDWNENLNYAVEMYGNGNQENFYTALLVNAGHFNPQQEKSTTFKWVDAGNDEFTKVLLHLDGTDDSTTDADFVDSSSNEYDVTQFADFKLEDTQKKFGVTSGYSDGNVDYLTVEASNDWSLYKNKSWTIDFWLYLVAASDYDRIVSQDGDTWAVRFSGASDNLAFTRANSGNDMVVTDDPVPTNEWHHYAVVFNHTEDNVSFYVDGAWEDNATTDWNEWNWNTPDDEVLLVSKYFGSTGYSVNGYIDELRISQGIVRWNGDFDVPTEEYNGVVPGDTTPPNVTINTPLNKTYHTLTTYFNVTALDETAMSNCSYTLNNGADNFTMSNASTSPTYWNATNSTMNEGGHKVIYYCRDTSNNLNDTANVSFEVELIPEVNYTVALPLGIIRFLNCSPDWEESDVRPDGQTSTIAAINATNNGTKIGDFTINLTGALNTGWTILVSNDSLVNNLTLSTTAQTIWSDVNIDETKKIWLAANCSYVSANPGQSIALWAG